MDKQKTAEYGVYVSNMITMKIHLKMSEIGSFTKQNLERKIVHRTEGKCIPEGYVRPDSVELITYSAGMVKLNMVEFQVVFKCLICNPVEGMYVKCITRTITKAGIHAEVITKNNDNQVVCIPMKIFIARDHNYNSTLFEDVVENSQILVKIIGKRFELNDPHIVAIATIANPNIKEHSAPGPARRDRITIAENEQEREPISLDYDSVDSDAEIVLPTARRNDKK